MTIQQKLTRVADNLNESWCERQSEAYLARDEMWVREAIAEVATLSARIAQSEQELRALNLCKCGHPEEGHSNATRACITKVGAYSCLCNEFRAARAAQEGRE
jgi:hypothetical protein